MIVQRNDVTVIKKAEGKVYTHKFVMNGMNLPQLR